MAADCFCHPIHLHHTQRNMQHTVQYQKPSPRTALADALRAFGRGLRSALTPQAIMYSLGIWLFAVLLWSAVTAAGWGWLREWFGGISRYVWLQEIIFYLITVLLFAALVFATVMLLTDFFLIPIIRRKVRPHYARASQLQDDTGMLNGEYIKNMLLPLLGFLLVPLVFWLPVIGAVILFVLLGYLNVRSFINDALDGICPPSAIRKLARSNRTTLALLGCILGGFALIPFIQILLPWTLGSATFHLAYDLLEREGEGENSHAADNSSPPSATGSMHPPPLPSSPDSSTESV